MRTKFLFLLMLCMCAVTAFGQGHKITGTVVSATDSESFIGVSVVVKGTTNGVITDLNGEFTITAPANSTLVFSYVGYKTKEVKVNGQTKLNVSLDEDSQMLDAIVVVGYGTAKKSDLTGAVVSANIKDFEKSPNTNLMQSLQGTVPGLNIGQITNAGGTPSISIRGKNTISGNTSVLIVLDGIIFTGDMSSINPADIASVDILKDASATAVYGAQAANGVMLITSKKGANGKAKINFSSSYTTQTPTNNMSPMNRTQLLQWDKDVLWHDAYTEESGYTKENPAFDLAKRMPDAYMTNEQGNIVDSDYNWWDNFTRTGSILENKLSISGGNDGLSYMMSVGNTTQKNFLLNDDFKRNTIRINLDAQPRSWWKAGVQAFGSFSNRDGQETWLPYLIKQTPLAQPYDEDGNLISFPMHTAVETPFHGSMVDDYDRSDSFFANIYSESTLPVKGLTYRFNFGNNYRIGEHNFASKYTNNENGGAYKNHSTYYDYTFDNILSYTNTFGKHDLSVTFVYGATRRKYMYTSATANVFPRMALGYNSLELADKQLTSSDAWKESTLYQMVRANYKYNNRYLVTATIRRDGYSGFAANHKFGTFPSIALGWIASEEEFFKIPWIDYLKVRGGYGMSGNQTNRYASLATVASEIGYIFGQSGALRQELSSMQNSDLKWERTEGINFGIDFTLFNSFLTGSLEIYQTTTHDLLYKVAIPSITGFTSIQSNVGQIQNKGVELNLTSHNITKKDFEWSTTFNISSNSNKVKSLTGIYSNGDGKEDDMIASSLFIGESLGAIYDYKVDRIYQIGDDIPEGYHPGNYRIVDVYADGKIDEKDRSVIGTTDPKYRMGLMNKFRYKNFNLSFFFNSVLGGKNGYLGQNTSSVIPNDNAIRENHLSEEADLFWSPRNTDGIYSRSWAAGAITPNRYEKRDFVRLQDVSFGYDLPKNVLNRIGLDGVNIYVNAKNLFTISGWHGWDPEADNTYQDVNGNNRVTGSGYAHRPVMKSFTAGINILF